MENIRMLKFVFQQFKTASSRQREK